MAGAPENPSKFDQDITQRSAGRHGSTGSRPDIWGAQHSPFQESTTSVNYNTFAAFPSDLDEYEMGDLLDFDPFENGTSVNVNEGKPEDNDPKPQIGMMFPSLEEAEEFYRNHAKKTGFTVRKGKVHKLADGALKWRRFLCSCQGHRAKKQSNEGTKYQRLDTRTGCQAHIQFTLEYGQYMITHLELKHNHGFKISSGSSDKSFVEALTRPILEGVPVYDMVCQKQTSKQIRPQAVESTRANGEIQTSLAPHVADVRRKELTDALRILENTINRIEGNRKEQLLERVTKSDSILQLQSKTQSSLPQQTQEDSLSSYSEESMTKLSDEMETACNYVQLTMEERSLPSPTLPITTITSARTPAAAGGGGGSSNPSLSCLKEVSHSHSHCSESIWQQILAKHGDITAKCTLTSPVFVAFVKQSILKIVELLQNNTARGLSREKLSTIGCMLGDLELVQVDIGWLRTRYVAVEYLIDYAKAKDKRDAILGRLQAKRAEVTELQVELDKADASLQELQLRVPDWLTDEDTLGKGLL